MRETKAFAFEIKEVSESGHHFEGLASPFGNIDDGGDIVDPKAFDATLPGFLAKGIIALYHDWNRPIGRPTKATVGADGLRISGSISDTQDGRDARTLMKDRVIQGLSIGYGVPRGGKSFLEKSSDVEDYWRSIGYNPTDRDLQAKERGARLLKQIDLFEVSPVPFPMNRHAAISHAKGSLPDTLAFDDHSEAVLAAVEEFKDRATALGEMRQKDGRTLAPERRAQLKRLRDELDALLLAHEPVVGDSEMLALFADFEQTRARILGVPV